MQGGRPGPKGGKPDRRAPPAGSRRRAVSRFAPAARPPGGAACPFVETPARRRFSVGLPGFAACSPRREACRTRRRAAAGGREPERDRTRGMRRHRGGGRRAGGRPRAGDFRTGSRRARTGRSRRIGDQLAAQRSDPCRIYYPPGSLKAKLCVAGKRKLYDFCASRGVEYRRCGKIIVATSEDQLSDLDRIQANAAANGVTDLERLTPSQASDMEPSVRCVGALWSPSTGIVDSHALMLALQGDAESAGAVVALLTPVAGGRAANGGIRLDCGGASPMSVTADVVVNSAGLRAQEVAALDRRRACRDDSADSLLQGQLLHAVRQASLRAPGLSGPRKRRVSACTSPSISPAA